ncbi:Disease resistance protein RPM1 [Triticum urartu]|uniref:Disease resistance protein RPM1 n=1 Tax=Triticum urartu TaxID=4572 RepID=M7YNA4_TRIUA|nr:Disease resistance protein RPM1 [Triticum urartu]
MPPLPPFTAESVLEYLEIQKEMKEALVLMEPLPPRISELLLKQGVGSVASDRDRRSLAYMEKELSTVVAALRQLTSRVLGPDHVAPRIKDRLAHLRELANWTWDLVDELAHGRTRYDTRLPDLNLTWIEQLLLVDAAGHDPSAPLSCDNYQLPQPDTDTTPHLVAMDGPRKKLLRWLMEDGEATKIISIIGPTGVGKTTLVVEVYSQVRQHFQCCATAKMSRQTSDAEALLRHIMSQIMDEAALCSNGYLLAHNIKTYLQDKRYLIIIDDIRKTTDLEIILEAFPQNECGSRVIITTPIRSIACLGCSHMDGLIHEVKPLDELESEKLFLANAFGADGLWPSEYSRQVSYEILRRCDGIPLFIIAMAGLMKQEQGEMVKRNAAYWLERVVELKHVEEALTLVYDNLPYELKLLTLYMSTFPWGYRIDKHRLISKWRAEGLIVLDMWRAFEEVAEECFTELLDRDIIRPLACKYNSEVETCSQVNYFMLQFLVSKSEQNFFLTTSHTVNSTAAAAAEGDMTQMIQRIFLHRPDQELPTLLGTIDLSHTRSLIVSGSVNRIPLDKFIHLAMLDLEGWENLEDVDLVQICSSNFFLLKYLSVRNTRVSKLPPQISELGYLETLDISHTQISEIPIEVWGLPKLWSLDLRGTQVRQLPRDVATCLRHLLVSGHKLDETIMEIPDDILYWNLLETLATIDIRNWSSWVFKYLADLRFLEVLAVTWSFHQCYDEEYQTALRSVIQRLGCLKSLTIQCEVGCSMEFLDSLSDMPNDLSDGPKDLQNLIITARFLTVPKWIQGLNHLAFLHITVCKLLPDDLKILGSLHKLECLVLGLDFLPQEAVVIERGAFHQLLRLSVSCRIAWLNFGEGAMLKLTDLDLNLSTGPVSEGSSPSGIGNLLSLEKVTLRYDPWYINSCSVKTTVDALRRQVAELQSTVKLVNNGVQEDVVAILDPVAGPTGIIRSETKGKAPRP